MKPATDSSLPHWTIRSEHSGAFLRLQRLVKGRASFTLCFLTYSDSVYRDEVAGFLEGRLNAHVRVAIDPEERIGTEVLFDRLSVEPDNGPAQLMGLESWPESFDDLLGRLNRRRDALPERCPRPLLVWVLSSNLEKVATRAADLWDWRSGVFDFTLPPAEVRTDRHQFHLGGPAMFAPDRQGRIERLQKYLAKHSPSSPADVDLLLDLGDLQRSLGDVAEAANTYSRALETVASLDDPRRRAITYGRIADIRQERGQLDEALRILTEEQLPLFEKLGDALRRPPEGHHAGQNRRRPADPRPTRRSPADPNRRRTARLRTTRRHPLPRHHPEQNRRHPAGTRATRRSPADTDRRTITRLRRTR